jgi:hypothetical protein
MKLKYLMPLLLGILAIPSKAQTEINAYGTDDLTSDICLIYSGGLAKRATWTKDNLRPYVVHEYSDGHSEWLYDGFLFLEFIHDGRVLANSGSGQIAGTKEDWMWWLDHVMDKGHDLHALDELIGELKQTLVNPPMRHKVIISTPAPCKDSSGAWADINWGEIDGEAINFFRQSHRLSATKWFCTQIKERFDAEKFENIDLAGIYWLEESLYSNGDIVPRVNDHIRTLGLKSYWIPYMRNNEQYKFNWKDKYRFDVAYQQPNYFFYDSDGTLPDHSQLVQAIEESKKYGLGLELEFETQDKSNGLHYVSPEMHQRLIEYIDAFEQYGVWDESAVAHYSGSKGMIQMAESTDPVDHATIDRLASIVVERHKKKMAGVASQEKEDLAIYAYAGEGEIFIASDACDARCYSMCGDLVHTGTGRFDCAAGIYFVTYNNGQSIKLLVK